MNIRKWQLSLALPVLLAYLMLLSGCGTSSSSSSSSTSSAQNGSVNVMISDASAQDWATIGVKVLNISLLRQGGGTPVAVYTAPTPAPVVNLVQLDQLAEILGKVSVPAGTYTGASLTIGANPGDVTLVVSSDPEPGFAGTPGQTIPSSQIQIQGATGTAGSLTVPVNVNLVSPLVVTANQSNALNLEFDLSHPAFLVEHVPAGGGSPIWAVNFNGPVRPRPIDDITKLVLRHIYGTVTAVSSDNTSITITRDFPVMPATSPESAISSSQSLQILADSVNGTIFYDVDAKTSGPITNFSSVASKLTGKFIRVAARYQSNGNLVAVRIWASSSFNSVWLNPEGHVLHVNSTTNVLTVENEDGTAIPLTVDANTKFFFRVPENGLADATPIAVGTSFLNGQNIVRGFKVHATVVDPLATSLVAQTVDIEIAQYGGNISSPTQTGFTYASAFKTSTDNYTVTLPYISGNTPNGKDANGNVIDGFKWWNLTFPTQVNIGAGAISNFISATGGTANFGGTVGAVRAFGGSYAIWNDPAAANAWSVPVAVLVPTSLPKGTVATGWVANSTGASFGLTVPNGTNTVTVDLSSVVGSATLVYQVDDTNNIITVSPQDLTTASGLNNVASHLVAGVPVRVCGIPQADGSIKAFVVFYFTGTLPA